ncbi:MAG: histidine phosphatase family protein [Armatimonadetes bacterium]|nr:histidine phosphatase family protein [Armatimonadota bacterium]
MRLILIRHGETDWNARNRFQGQTDIPLNTTGRRQARVTGRRLRHEPVGAVYTSDLTRALETAHLIAASHVLEVRPSPALRERSFGAWEGLTMQEIEKAHPESASEWKKGDVYFAAPEGERLDDLQKRSVACVEEIIARHPGETVLIVGHGASLKTVILHFLEAPLTVYRRFRQDNASLNIVEFTPRGMPRILALNDTCHLHDTTLLEGEEEAM